jgi:DNA-binding MarR family transcriptional regulator
MAFRSGLQNGVPGLNPVNWWLKARQLRKEILGPDLFSDAAWNILLHLYSLGEKAAAVKITALAPMTGLPRSTAGKWSRILIDAGYLDCYPAADDQRISYVRMSHHGFATMARYFEELPAVVTETMSPVGA